MPVLPSEGRSFQGSTPQVHHLPTALYCGGLGGPQCPVGAVSYCWGLLGALHIEEHGGLAAFVMQLVPEGATISIDPLCSYMIEGMGAMVVRVLTLTWYSRKETCNFSACKKLIFSNLSCGWETFPI